MNNNEVIRVLLVGGNKVMREELSQMLSSEEGTIVIGEVRSGEQALVEARKLSPDVVIMLTDDGMPGMDVIEPTRAITGAQIPARVIIITENLTRYLVPAIKAGAAGLVSKNISGDELSSAIRKIYLWSPGSFPSQ